jgi:hypothetical protein
VDDTNGLDAEREELEKRQAMFGSRSSIEAVVEIGYIFMTSEKSYFASNARPVMQIVESIKLVWP